MAKVKTRKDVIKNVAIVFLIIMLVLTFFSNTIMNFSLAQVNGKYTEYGSIRTGVRGSGTVQANTVFEQAVKGDARVEEVMVREGDRVEAGQVLMILESSEQASNEAEIKALEEQLKSLEDAYERALLSRGGEADYTLTEMDIADAREKLEKLKEKRAEFTDELILEINTEFENAETAVVTINETIEALEEQINEVSEKSDDPKIVEAKKKLENAKSVLKYAEECLARDEEKLAGVSYTDTSALSSQYSAMSRELGKLEADRQALKTEYATLLGLEGATAAAKTAYETALSAYEVAYGAFDGAVEPTDDPQKTDWQNVNTLKAKYESAKTELEANADAIKAAKAEIKALDERIDDANYEMSLVSKQISSAKSENKTYNNYKVAVETSAAEVENCKKAVESAEEALTLALESIAKDLTTRLKTERAKLKEAEKRLEEATERKAEADGVEELDGEIKTSERTLFEMEYNLEKQKASDEKAATLEEYDFKKQKEEIDGVRAELYKLKGKTTDGPVEFKAKYNGTVTSFNCRVGDTLSDGMPVITIESEESGYTLSFSVDNKEASKLKVGDTATVSGGYWGSSLSAILSEIKTEQGGKTKKLTFELSGDVVTGQTLTLLAGEKSTSYSSVVPKSAIREDSEGKYVYITKTKSTPLGNRYVATRLPVEIVASDDVNAAITSPEMTYIYEFAITSSTKPIADGDFVRLAD